MNNLWVLVAMIVYFIAMLSIGFFYSKRSNSSASQYFAGGRGVGPWLTALSAEASDMSGWLLMGLPGLAYATGVANAGWTAAGLAIGTYANWKIVAKRLRRYSAAAGNAITLPDFFSKRFDDSRNILSTLSAVIIIIFFSVYVGSCFVTVGKLFDTLFGFDYHLMMIIGAIIVFAYTVIGGYLSVVATDFIQGLLMFFALIVVFTGTIASVGGIEHVAAVLQSIPGYLGWDTSAHAVVDSATGMQQLQQGMPQFAQPDTISAISIISLLAWGLGYFGMPQVLVRFLSIRDAEEITQSRIIATTWCVISLACAIAIGLVGRAMLPAQFLTQASAETIFIVLSQMLLPSLVCGIVVSGIFAASMSSSSSYMIIAGSAVAENLFRGVLHRRATDRQVMIVARATMAVIFCFGCAVAWEQNSSIFEVVSYAWAGLGAAFGPLMLCCLYWRRTTLQGALAGMVSGSVVVLVWPHWVAPLGGIWSIYELLPAFIVALLAIVVVSLATRPPSAKITDVFDHYMDADRTVGDMMLSSAQHSELVEGKQ